MPGTCRAGSHFCAIAGRDMWAANNTAVETTSVPEPDGQQDLDARAVEDWQEKGHSLILSPYS